jgi:hypothetical protein
VRRTWREGSFTRESERYAKGGSGNEASLHIQGLCKGNLEGGLLRWGLRDTSRKTLETEQLCLYRVMWRKASFTEELERHVHGGCGNKQFLQWFCKGT